MTHAGIDRLRKTCGGPVAAAGYTPHGSSAKAFGYKSRDRQVVARRWKIRLTHDLTVA
jgi:hypothetical protein